MELWSKGLGRRVLSMSLGERTGVARTPAEVSVDGIMHAPTYWEYSVLLDGDDIVDFLGVLEEPDALRFVARDKSFGRLLTTAGVNAARFLGNTALVAMGRAPADDEVIVEAREWGGMGYVPEGDEEEEGVDSGGS